MTDHFSSSYAEARRKFVELCATTATHQEAFRNPHVNGPDGEPLWLDVAWFGSRDARRVFFTVSGTHGQEGFAGGAAQVQWIHDHAASTLPEGLAVMFVHASNPWGWAHFSRVTESNVDLNRNFLDHGISRPAHPAYHAVEPLVTLEALTEEALAALWGRFEAVVQRHGKRETLNALMSGQYHDPRGMNYGGTRPVWSNHCIRDIVGRLLRNASKVGFIDWHTGMGEYGEPFFMCFDDETDAAFRRAAQWWGRPAMERGSRDTGEGMPRPDYQGLLLKGVREELALTTEGRAEFTAVVVELGTYPAREMMKALVIDRSLRFFPPADEQAVRHWRSYMLERFCPASEKWRSSVLAHSAKILERGIAGLNEQ